MGIGEILFVKNEMEKFEKEEELALAENKKSFCEINSRLASQIEDIEFLINNEEDSKKRMELLNEMWDKIDERLEAHKNWQQGVLDILAERRRKQEELLKVINPTMYKIYSKFTKRRRA